MRLAAVLLFGFLVRFVLSAQDLPAPVETQVELARTAAPELTADTILKLAEDGRLPAGAARNQRLEEAFMAAARAQEPLHLIPVPGLIPNTRAIFRAQANELRLDALSLESRVLKLVAKTDPEAARRLFDNIPHPELEPRPCEDPFIADVSAYYEIAGELGRSQLAQSQAAFLEAALLGARSPGELAAFAQVLATVSPNSEQQDFLVAALAA